MFPDQVAVLKLSDGSDDAHAEEHVLWVIDEVSAIEESARNVNDTNCNQPSVNPVVEMVSAHRIRVDAFIFENVVLLVDVFGVE